MHTSFKALLFSIVMIFLIMPLFPEGIEEVEGIITVEDALGRNVSLIDVPSRIVLAGRATILLTDALYLFEGVSDRVLGVGATDQGLGDFFEVLDADPGSKARLGKSAGPEEILARKPDLVILKSYMRDSLGRGVETAGVPVLYLDLETPAQYRRDLRILGTILKQDARAEELISLYDERIAELGELLAGLEPTRTLLLQVSGGGGSYSFSIAPRGWIQSDQVELAGGMPVWYDKALSPGWNQVQFEQIALWNPEAIVLVNYRGSAADIAADLRKDELWSGLNAVSQGRIFGMPADYYSWGQSDSRWILGAQWLAYALHPEAFSSPFVDRVYAFFSDFYGFDRETVAAKILPRLEGELF